MESDTEVDFFSMPGGKSVNTAKDKTLKGRVLSEADNAITAVWESVAKTATYSGWADFKHALNDVYEEQVQAALANGMSQQEALAEATRLTGITKQKMQGTTRTSDNVLVRKENGQYYEYRIPDEAINALKSSNQEYSNWLNDLIAKPTRWYARGVTQFTVSDEDEGGNELDKQGDIDRYIPIPSPFEKGKYIKIPVGFGMPQMAWSFATNLVKAGHSHISVTEAATNMFMHTVKATVPVSPSEISAEKYPIEKATLTATPSIFQPIVQIALNRNAFGSPITTGFVSDKKLKADQAKANTAPFWKETALWLSDAGIADMHPEQLKALWDGYSGMLGSLREVATIMVENPNRERLGKVKRIPFLNTFYGSGNEYAIQSLFYQATEEARAVHNSYTSRKERGTLPADWLTPERKAIVQWIERVDKETQEIRKAKAKVTKAYNDKKISEARYQLDVNKYDRIMETVQRRNLHKWRRMQGLNTSKPLN